jgi:predicted membrane protein
MRKMKTKDLFWGVILIGIAAIIILGKLDLLGGINGYTGVVALGCVFFLIRGIVKIEFSNILFAIAVLIILFDEQLHLEAITPWPVLGAACLGSIGLSMIFKKKHTVKMTINGKNFEQEFSKEGFKETFKETVIDNDDQSFVECSVVFSSSIKYVNSENFKRANLECHFGSLQVYFDKAVIQEDTATINVDCNFGKVDLIFPRQWNVVTNLDSPFAGVSVQKNPHNPDGPTVYVNGDVTFGSGNIRFM